MKSHTGLEFLCLLEVNLTMPSELWQPQNNLPIFLRHTLTVSQCWLVMAEMLRL